MLETQILNKILALLLLVSILNVYWRSDYVLLGG